MRFNRDIFKKKISEFYGQSLRRQLSSSTLTNLETLLFLIEFDNEWTLTSEIAYFLATIGWETAWTYAPIVEKRANSSQKDVRRMQDRYWNTKYFGRGYVQLTWKDNYKKMSPIAGIDLVKNPDALLRPSISYEVAAVGMRKGLFRSYANGKPVRLSDYVNTTSTNFVQARNVINGDIEKNGPLIANFASNLHSILNLSLIKEITPPNISQIVPLSETQAGNNTTTMNNSEPSTNQIALGSYAANTAPWSPPIQVDPTAPIPTAGPKSIVTTISSIVSSLGITGSALYGYISGIIPNLNPTILITICLFCIAIITCVYIASRIYLKNSREQRAALLDMQKVEITADPTKANVVCAQIK